MLRRTLPLLACAILLAGCESYGDLTSDAFEPGSATQSRFTLDSADCSEQADAARDYSIPGIAGTHVERHEIYNRVYASCMTKSGYGRRDWSPDIPVPYVVDPRPG